MAVKQKYFTPQMAVVSPPSLNLPTRKRYLNHDKVIFPKIQTRNVSDWLKFVKRYFNFLANIFGEFLVIYRWVCKWQHELIYFFFSLVSSSFSAVHWVHPDLRYKLQFIVNVQSFERSLISWSDPGLLFVRMRENTSSFTEWGLLSSKSTHGCFERVLKLFSIAF